jgi:hypothetical protein
LRISADPRIYKYNMEDNNNEQKERGGFLVAPLLAYLKMTLPKR